MEVTDNRVVHIWGAGVDKCLGMPLAGELLTEIARFSKKEGKPIADAIRAHLPHLLFSFDRFTGEQGENFAQTVLTGDPQTLVNTKSALDKYLKKHEGEDSGPVNAVRKVVEALEKIRDSNWLEDSIAASLATVAGEVYQPSGGDYIINPKYVHLVPIVRQAFRRTFQGLAQEEGYSDDERQALTAMALSLMNVEELLGQLFSGFYTKKPSDQKQYLFVAWMLWAYLRLKMETAIPMLPRSPYRYLDGFGDNNSLITLNYTARFIEGKIKNRVQFFHGDCTSYIRLDTRELVSNDESAANANTIETIKEFIGKLPMNLNSGEIYLPGIIPPLSVKPVMCREHLRTWYQCGEIIDDARAIVIMGYSFNLVDEHFNDLLRKRKGGTNTKIVVINPDIDCVVPNVCNILSKPISHLTDVTTAGFSCKQAAGLLFANAKAEEITPEKLQILIGGER